MTSIRKHYLVYAILLFAIIIFSLTRTQQDDDNARIAYLYVNAYGVTTLWTVDPNHPDNTEQLSPDTHDILDYDVSPDGRKIVYTHFNDETNASDLSLLDVAHKSVRLLTQCTVENVNCHSPTFNPVDDTIIAYERTPLGEGFDAEGEEASTQIWMLHVSDEDVMTGPLFANETIPGYGITWGGSRIAFYSNGNILIYNFDAMNAEDELLAIPAQFGVAGSISPYGSDLIFPELVTDGTQTRAFLQIANLNNGTLQLLTQPDDGADDQTIVWSPDGRYVVLGRRYTDQRYTLGPQMYLIDMQDRSIRPLVVDKRYSHGFFDWNADSTQIVLQRFQLIDDYDQMINQGKPQIWLYNLNTGEMIHIVDNGRNPMWINR